MTHEHGHERDETRLKAMLRSVDADAPPPDVGVLEALRQRAADVFASAAEVPVTQPTASGGSPISASSSLTPTSIRPHRRSFMFTLILRSSLAISAAMALLAVWLNPFVPQAVGGSVPFSKVLEELRGATTLHLQLDKSGQTSEILVRAPGLVRRQESPQRYQIAAGSRLWKVDEAQNTVVEGDSPWFLNSQHHVDLLGLLEVGLQDASPLLVARPFQRMMFGGHDCFAYRVDLPGKSGRIRVEAFADASNNQLVGIIARHADAQANAQPLAELRLVALNQPVADEKFAVAKSLTEDGRIGKISQAQGIVVLRPMLGRRWTPVCHETLLRPGDWLRSEMRGANAVKVTLSSDVELTLGPGTLIEFISPAQARIHNGQVQVQSGPAAAPADANKKPVKGGPEFTLLAPRDGSRLFKPGDKQLVHVDRNEKIVDVPGTPVWLAGFEGTSNNESLGSLIVQVDGRNEPLSVGYHKVSVEIRDQIARTTIEESFVNHTLSRLEGVFHFPLPQDASISGFGMWIGNDLVEADVVEKQRAREIFETILREKRDPGLLEWMGGNIFKARVFPIEPQSEKRVKIVYTQVLPLRANRYRYSYGLRSELLRTKPLRELSLNVTVNSALPLKSVSCPTHTVRALQTGHSAQVEFAAQDYTPTRDFEVVCEVDGKQSDVVVIPHRRGSDGYFLIQLSPPAPEGNWQRELLPDGKPLNVLLLCDTSMSMDSEKRRQQAEFVGTVLTSLGGDDRFQLVCADVGTASASTEPMAANVDNVAKARSFLEDRISLGWTNLDRAFADVIQKTPTDAHVIYVGDGIVSAGSTDPAAFVQRFKQLVGSPANREKGTRRTFHSVTVGNSHETVVLRGIAAVGGGSTRSINGEQTPQIVALELLNEIAQPGLRELNVEFRGLKVAAVYPGQLPNVAAGTQQILVGRYLPEGKDQSGEIVVTGLRGNEKVKYSARVNLKDAEEGNSFIPRLWARAHLDQLMAQGQSAAIRDDIISLSEEFHIITPYTSLLVLETDADRERFGVKRRYEMRDGERFFAEGRNNASFELAQAQMKRAGSWRIALRSRVLRNLKNLGRNTQELQALLPELRRDHAYGEESGARFSGLSMLSDGMLGRHGGMGGLYAEYPNSGGMGGGMGGLGWGGGDMNGFATGLDVMLGDEGAEVSLGLAGGESDRKDLMTPGEMGGEEADERLSLGVDADEPMQMLADGESNGLGEFEQQVDEVTAMPAAFPHANGRLEKALKRQMAFAPFGRELRKSVMPGRYAFDGLSDYRDQGRVRLRIQSEHAPLFCMDPPSPDEELRHLLDSTSGVLFPALAAAVKKPADPPKDLETWSAEALAISTSLLRTDSLRKFDGGIELRRVVDQLDPRWNRRSSRHSDLVLYSPAGWLTRSLDLNEQTIVDYCTPQERGVYSLAFLLGRKRAAVEADLGPHQMGLTDFSLQPLHEMYYNRVASLEAAGENRAKLILTLKDSTHVEQMWIDTSRHVVVKHEWLHEGRIVMTRTYDDFVEVAGSWWARKLTQLDGEGLKTSESNLQITSLTKPQHVQRIDAELAAKPSVQFLLLPFVKFKVARQKTADGAASFDDRLAMILHNVGLQQWDEMWKHVDAIEKLAADKPGVRWIRTILQAIARKNEESHQRLLLEARQLAAKPQQDEVFLADFMLKQSHPLLSWPEFLELVQLLKPVYERQPADLEVVSRWTERLAQCHEAMGHSEQALALRRSLAESAQWHIHWQTDHYASRLAQLGQFDLAHAWLQKELDRPMKRPEQEDETLRTAVAELFRMQTRWADLLKFTTDWIGRKPESMSYNSAYAQHLTALVFNDQLDQANALVQQWFNESRIEGKLKEDQRARLEAGLNFAMGQSYNLSFQHMDERWYEPLGQVARFFVRHPHHGDIAARIVTHHQFQQSDTADRLRGEFLVLLQTDNAKLTPSQISNLVGWTLGGRMELPNPIQGRRQLDASEIPNEIWKQIASSLKLQWTAALVKGDKHSLGESLRSVYSHRFADDLLLPFVRERIVAEHADFKLSNISTLFETLLTTKWTAEIEQEAFALLRELSDAENPQDRLPVQLPALYRLVDAKGANRQAASLRKLNDQGAQDKLTRKELAAKKEELRRLGRVELSARLAAEAKQEDGPLSSWFKIEQTWLDVQLGQNLPQVNEFCWQILGNAPPEPPANDDDIDDDVELDPVRDRAAMTRVLEGILKQRAFTTVMSLSTRRSAKPDEVERVLKFINAGIAQGQAAAAKLEGVKPQESSDCTAAWRNTKFRFLVALDRPDDLDRELRQWIREDVSTGPWRQSLARLVAERGKLDEAIQLFEACEKDKLLTSSDYKMLADWYLVVDRRAAYDRSRIESFKMMPEGNLGQLLNNAGYRCQQQQPDAVSTEVDEETLFAFKAFFEKATAPEQYLWSLQRVYAGSRDFRILQMIPDAVLGRSPQQIYAYLIQLNSQVLHELRNEAAADEIMTRIKTLRAGERTETDLRALDLLEALVERKSSELLNQPGPHLQACLAALKRAFARKWGDGEPRMMSNFLSQLGQLRGALADEQLREMRELQKLAPANSRDHLNITSELSMLVGTAYGRLDEAIREMEIEVRAYSQANNGNWPHLDNNVLSNYVSLYEQARLHSAGEAVLQKFMAKSEHAEQRKWFDVRLMSLYNNALEHDGAVSLGSGRAMLLDPVYKLFLKQIEQSLDEGERYAIISQVANMFGIAHRHKIAGAAEMVQKFAFDVMPAVLKRQTSQYRNSVIMPLQVLADLAGFKAALRYIVERFEQYPQRLEISWESSWQVFGYELARRREESGPSELDARVLMLVVRELQRELRTGESRNPQIYHSNQQYFWKEKAGDFARAAEALLAESKSSGRRVVTIANYFWSGLQLHDRAIEVMFVAHKQGLLEESAQVQLAEWLHQANRHAESIPLLETLVAARMDIIDYRVRLMRACFHCMRPEQLKELIQQTDGHFHDGGRWTEGNVAAFGHACFECGQWEPAIQYLTEAIALRQRGVPGSGRDDDTLASYYSDLARSNSALGRTKEAVDAASGAVVCWGPHNGQRAQQLATLNEVLSAAEDLDACVAQLDAEVAKSGQDSPIIRKAIGLNYKGRMDLEKAITQLRLAVDLQPHDAETHKALMECYDETANSPAATRQLLKLIDLHRHDLALYLDLANRLKDNEVEAERAATSIIEASPNEAENHAAMAELRQNQERWSEAIPHWEQVAELRKLEPNGLLKLADAQLHEKQWDAARATIAKLRKTEWPARFGDVQNQTKQLESRIPR